MPKLSDYFEYRFDANGEPYLQVNIRGYALLRLPATNKGSAFTVQERIELELDGLLPPCVNDLDRQLDRVYGNFQKQVDDIAKYQFLSATQDRSEVLFYALLERHLQEMVPIIYTPTIGLAVQQYSSLYNRARGLTLSAENIDRADSILKNYPWHDIRMIVVTDASAILGIGDQGMGGLAICIGKLALYTAGGGLCPFQTLPLNLDVGTNRTQLRDDPHYLGMREPRMTGAEYFALVDKFVSAVSRRWPKAIIQWEDFAKNVAFDVLQRYRQQLPSFNDDIQGTGAVALAGVLSACRLQGKSLAEQVFVIVGAGAGGIGVASIIKEGLLQAGLSEQQAQQQIYVVDGCGLVVQGHDTDEYKRPLAHQADIYQHWHIATEQRPNLAEVVSHAKPSVLIGLSGVPGLFTEAIIKTMAVNHPRPIIFPLSNPTDNCEALPSDIITWTAGQAIVASGSPFADVEYAGVRCPIGQGNNAFIFPGLGFAAVLGECRIITDAMVLAAAYALADYTEQHGLAAGLIYPPVQDLKKVSLQVATRVLATAIAEGVTTRQDLPSENLTEFVQQNFWQAKHLPFRYVAED